MSNWKGVAFNQVPDSANQIHGDEMAKKFGFKGGLVPGVTVSAYLLHPAAEAFGMDFLERGFAHCRVNSPLYDEETFEVEVTDQGETHLDTCLKRESGELLAVSETKVVDTLPDAPVYRGDPVADKDYKPAAATRANLEALQANGCQSLIYRWNEQHEMGTYLRDRTQMSKVYAVDGYANPSYILGISNWVLSANIYMNPWVHLETRSQNFAALSAGTKFVSEMTVTDLFEKKGHEFVDAEVNLFDIETQQCYTSINLRAIYHLRGA